MLKIGIFHNSCSILRPHTSFFLPSAVGYSDLTSPPRLIRELAKPEALMNWFGWISKYGLGSNSNNGNNGNRDSRFSWASPFHLPCSPHTDIQLSTRCNPQILRSCRPPDPHCIARYGRLWTRTSAQQRRTWRSSRTRATADCETASRLFTMHTFSYRKGWCQPLNTWQSLVLYSDTKCGRNHTQMPSLVLWVDNGDNGDNGDNVDNVDNADNGDNGWSKWQRKFTYSTRWKR